MSFLEVEKLEELQIMKRFNKHGKASSLMWIYIWKKGILPIRQQIVEKKICLQRMKIAITKPRERESIRAALKPIIQKHIDDYYKAWTTILFQEKDK